MEDKILPDRVCVYNDSIRLKLKKMVLGEPYMVEYKGDSYKIIKPEKNIVDIYLVNGTPKDAKTNKD
jgi:hypothetical protein